MNAAEMIDVAVSQQDQRDVAGVNIQLLHAGKNAAGIARVARVDEHRAAGRKPDRHWPPAKGSSRLAWWRPWQLRSAIPVADAAAVERRVVSDRQTAYIAVIVLASTAIEKVFP